MPVISPVAWLGAILILVGEAAAVAGVRDLKRMLAFSTLAEIGYVVMGLGLGSAAGETGAWMHLGYQAVMRALVLLAARRLMGLAGSSRLADLVGSGERAPFVSLMFGFGLFSVMGLSPFKGSFSKFVILYAAIEQGGWGLAAAGTLGSIVAAYYYIETIQQVCFQRPRHGILADEPVPFLRDWRGHLPLALLAVVSVVMSLDPDPFLTLSARLAGLAGPDSLPAFETHWGWAVLLPYLGAFLLFGLGRISARLRDVSAVALGLAGLVLVWVEAQPGDLGGLFAILFAAVGFLACLYSVRYMAHAHAANRYFFFLFLMIGSLIGVATSRHLGNFYVFWELMTWTSYLLVIHEQTTKALKAGMIYFLICAGGAYVMHFGILLLHAELGSFEIGEISQRIGDLSPGMAGLVLACFLTGFIAKAGLFPLQAWLPRAHPVAPSSISAPMSGILTKAGIFGIVKLLFGIFGFAALGRFGLWHGLTAPGGLLVGLGAVTFLLGEVQAWRQTDVKRLLAYSTLAQIGEIAMLVGIATPLALTGALLHVVNHAAMKTLLFLAAGILILRAGGKELDDLKGIGRAMPFPAVCFGIGLLAIMGVPPFGGFVAKFLMIYASLAAGQTAVAVVILAGSVIGAMYYARLLRVVFFEPYRGPAVEKAPASICLVLALLTAVVLVNGLWPAGLLSLVRPVVENLAAASGLSLPSLPPLTMDWSWAALIAAGGAGLSYLLGRSSARRAGWTAVATMAAAGLAVVAQPARYDGLSFAFALLVAGVGLLNLLYSIGYMAKLHAPGRFFCLFQLMISGLLGIAASADLFNFLAFWEVMSSWTLYLVIIHEETPEALGEGYKYFIFNFAGASLLFLGLALLAAKNGGHFALADLEQAAAAMPAGWLTAAGGLIFAGFLMKAAQLPARIDYQMHPAPAPTPVSGYISAVLLKAGPYALLKFFLLLGGAAAFARLAWWPGVMPVVSAIAAVTLLYAGAMAVVQTGIKRLLIYSTVSQLGYILLGLSLGTPLGIAGGLMHLVNHMMLKNILFLGAGCLLAQAHVSSLDELGGAGRRMPVTFGLFLFAGLSLSGVPPFNGFASKWMIYQAAFQSGHPLLALAALMSSLFTLAALLKFVHAAFLGPLSPKVAAMREPPATMLAPMLLLAAVCLAVGLLPGLLLVPIAAIMAGLGLEPVQASWTGGLPGGWHPAWLSLAMLAAVLPGWLYRRFGASGRQVAALHTCGVSGLAPGRMRLAAAALYDTPSRLIRTVLFAKPTSLESHTHD